MPALGRRGPSSSCLPAACLAIRTARPDQRDKVKGLLVPAAATSILTGITEPVEFAFLYSPPYGVHVPSPAPPLLSQLPGCHGFGSSAGIRITWSTCT